jgi:glycosyltransferase involved in cell wall biosynthesis
MTRSQIDVIVPVRNREKLLAALLAALQEQTFTDFGVIVVDDGSDDGSRELAEAAVVRGRPVRVVAGSGHGAVDARCLGVAASTAPYVAFTDSDCAPAPGWLAAGVAALESGADLVHGLTEPARPAKPLERSLSSGDEGLYPTCNAFYRRSAYDSAGGFDEGAASRLGFRLDHRAKGLGFGEDTLLGWRVRRSGGVAVYEPAALVAHHVFPVDLRESFGRSVMAAAFPGLIREVPELRQTLLRRRLVLGSAARLPLYAAVGASLLGRRRLAAIGLALWSAWEWRDLAASSAASTAELARAMPAVLAVDAVFATALAVGGVRHRTLVL